MISFQRESASDVQFCYRSSLEDISRGSSVSTDYIRCVCYNLTEAGQDETAVGRHSFGCSTRDVKEIDNVRAMAGYHHVPTYFTQWRV